MTNKINHTNTPSLSIRDIFGAPLSEKEALQIFANNPELYNQFTGFRLEFRNQLLRYLQKECSIHVCYDPFFQKIFSPYEKQNRLERFISCILDEEVEIIEVLSREGTMIAERGSLVVMDIIVKERNGSIINIEMQKIGYDFSGERSDCYIADSIMRQYNATKSIYGDKFSYHYMKPSYLIILMEKSPREFKSTFPEYIHKKLISYSSGVQIASLENIRYISLDTFQAVMQNKSIETELEAWLMFLCCRELDCIDKLLSAYPEFIELYQEINDFRQDPKELIGMFSDALRIMDHNMELYMIDELKKENKEKDAVIAEKDSALAEKDIVIAENQARIAEYEQKIKQLQAQLKTN